MSQDRLRKAQGKRLATAREAAGYRSAREAALDNHWPESSYRAHERGTRTIGQDDAERYASRFRAAGADVSAQSILFGDEEPAANPANVVPIMGYVGAGADVSPDDEQIPSDGLEQVELPYPVEKTMVGFRVVGDSMSPAYEEDSIVLVEREQPTATDGMIGRAAAVRIIGPNGESRRLLKRLRSGSRRDLFDLESINDRSPTIRDVRIVWASPVRMIVPNIGIRRLSRKPGSATGKGGKRPR